jgi:hypothetical protein
MPLIADDGSEFDWSVTGSTTNGFRGHYLVRRPSSRSVEAEADSQPCPSRDQAVAWLRLEARDRGFDARGIK